MRNALDKFVEKSKHIF